MPRSVTVFADAATPAAAAPTPPPPPLQRHAALYSVKWTSAFENPVVRTQILKNAIAFFFSPDFQILFGTFLMLQ